METSAPAQSASDRYPRAASPIHMIFVLTSMGGWAIGHKIFVYQLSATANPEPRALLCGYHFFYPMALVRSGRGGRTA